MRKQHGQQFMSSILHKQSSLPILEAHLKDRNAESAHVGSQPVHLTARQGGGRSNTVNTTYCSTVIHSFNLCLHHASSSVGAWGLTLLASGDGAWRPLETTADEYLLHLPLDSCVCMSLRSGRTWKFPQL